MADAGCSKFLDFIIGAYLNIQHPAGKGNHHKVKVIGVNTVPPALSNNSAACI